MLFALDVATHTASIALFDRAAGQLLAELTWQARRRHTQDVLSQIQRLLNLMHLTPRDLTALAVTTGPGSFTGVRIGVSLVKGMAMGLPTPPSVIAAPTLMVTAQPWRAVAANAGATICALLQAGRGRYNWVFFAPDNSYARPGAADHQAGDVRSLVDALEQRTDCPIWLVGEVDDELHRRMAALPHITVIDPTSGLRRAGCLAQLAQRLFLAGIDDSTEALQPLYLQTP